jgi:hypothetical protein
MNGYITIQQFQDFQDAISKEIMELKSALKASDLRYATLIAENPGLNVPIEDKLAAKKIK